MSVWNGSATWRGRCSAEFLVNRLAGFQRARYVRHRSSIRSHEAKARLRRVEGVIGRARHHKDHAFQYAKDGQTDTIMGTFGKFIAAGFGSADGSADAELEFTDDPVVSAGELSDVLSDDGTALAVISRANTRRADFIEMYHDGELAAAREARRAGHGSV